MYYIASQAKVIIKPPTKAFESMSHRSKWFSENVKVHCNYMKRLEATFVQASEDALKQIIKEKIELNQRNF